MILRPELLWDGARFVRNREVEVADGSIVAVRASTDTHEAGRALLPGFVNAHSHAFQRGLRGRGETFPAGQGSFWTWREAMYELVESLDLESAHALCLQAFREMVRAGMTTVGEFHYLHHLPGSEGYELDEVVIDAARTAGLRMVLLHAYYNTGGFDQPLEGGQRQFRSATPDAYWKQIDALDGKVELGCVLHSVRAATRAHLRDVRAEAKRRGLVTHIHLEEQRREIEECRAHYGVSPMQLVLDEMAVDDTLVAVHCTHSTSDEMAAYRGAGGRVNNCPLTEANLGDGLPDGWFPVSLGSDSNARISMLEEMRWLEYGQRLRNEERGALRAEDGSVAPGLLRCGTVEGSEALGIPAGRIEAGCHADFVSIDLDHPSLAGWTDETLAAALVFGCPDDVIAEVSIEGRPVYSRS
ncbi:MAG: formimidoylglutamate deiminase [Planctomycetota bacterium]